MTNDERPQGVTDFEEAAWCLIANASGGDWTRESDEWRAAAARWREQYHAKLSAALQPAAEAQGEAELTQMVGALRDCYEGCPAQVTTASVKLLKDAADTIERLAAPPSAQGVPREPTAAMFIAGTKALAARMAANDIASGGSFARHVWYAMFDAAIAAQGEQAGGEQG